MALHYDFTACPQDEESREVRGQWGFGMGLYMGVIGGLPVISKDGETARFGKTKITSDRATALARLMTMHRCIGPIAGTGSETTGELVRQFSTLLDAFEGAKYTNCAWKTDAEFLRDVARRVKLEHAAMARDYANPEKMARILKQAETAETPA